MSDLADFFVAGGTLRPQAPSYVTRPADQELFEHVLAGDFCYVLTARQMGKSSLMVRTTRRLKAAGVATATIDLTGIGDTQADTWYISLLTRIKKGLQLSVDVAVWWSERAELGAPQRFTEFLRDIALEECAGPIAIFVDEIDSTLSLKFRDDFFAAIRAIYNARASDPAYNRLTFVLLGVATPTDLISDRQRTPFNIGRRIALREFDATDARPLQAGLEAIHPGQSDAILDRIFYWTNGHPYLTQKLCSAAAQSDRAEWTEHDVDALVEISFFTKEARKESNLQFVQDRIRSTPADERRRMLKLYRQLYAAKTVPDDDRSPIQNHLELSGLVGVEAGKLRIRNRIYQRVFDQGWIADNTPANTQLRIIVAASLFTLLLVAFIIYRTLNPVTQATAEASVCIENFKNNTAIPARREALACLFNRPEYTEAALRLFYTEMDTYNQKNLFLSSLPEIPANDQIDRQTVTVIKGIYTTLDDEMSNDLDIMDAMLNVLNVSQQQDAAGLKTQIESWQKGRRDAENRQYDEAVGKYSLVINSNDENIGAHYDRASVYIELQKYGEALEDLNKMIVIAKTAPPTPTPAPTSMLIPTSIIFTPTSVFTVTSTPSVSPVAGTPIGTLLSTNAIPTITVTPVITSTTQDGVSTSRFISTELIIKTVADTIRGNEELLRYLQNPQNQTAANQDLIATLGLSSIVQLNPTTLRQTVQAEVIANLTAEAVKRATDITFAGSLANATDSAGTQTAIALILTGPPLVEPPIATPICVATQPLGIMLVIDQSSSMDGGELVDAQQAAIGFVEQTDLTMDQIGLVAFSNTASLGASLGRDRSMVVAAIQRLKTQNGTNIAAGLNVAQEELLGGHRDPTAKPVLILLSDGKPNKGDTLSAVASVKAQGIVVITIGLGKHMDEALLREMASSEADYHYAPSSADLEAVYREIALSIHNCE